MNYFKNNKEKILTFVFLILTLCVIIPVIFGCGYTYLCEDDFSFEAGGNDMVEAYHSQLGPFVRAYEYYMSNQGTYLFNTLVHALRIYTRWGLQGIHVYMVLINAAFAFSLYYLIKTLFKKTHIAMGIMFAASYAVYQTAGTINNIELFYWYTGTLNFTVGITLAFFALGLLINYMNAPEGKENNKLLIASMICAFLGSGCALEVSAPNCAFLLAVVSLSYPAFKKNRKVILPFVSAMVGAVINVLAPGNYNRANESLSEGHTTVFDAFRDTFTCYINESRTLLGSPVFIILLATVFIACYLLKARILSIRPTLVTILITTVGSFLVQYFTMFPVCFGYHSDSLLRMRTTGTYELIAKIMYIFAVVCIAQWAWEKEKKIASAAIIIAYAATLLLCAFSGRIKDDIKNGFSYMTFCDLKDGSMKDAYYTRAYIFSSFELAEKGTDAIVYVPLRSHPQTAYGIGLLPDCEWFVNRSAAGLWDLRT